jgi:hypothetical protein
MTYELGHAKASAKHDLLFNKLTSDAGSLNKSLCLALGFGVTKFTSARYMFSVTLKSDLNVNQTREY